MVLGEMMAIAASVARERGLTVEVIRGPGRTRTVFLARAEAMKRMRETGRSYARIGRFFGRDHSTVIHAIRVAMAGPAACICPTCGARRRVVVARERHRIELSI